MKFLHLTVMIGIAISGLAAELPPPTPPGIIIGTVPPPKLTGIVIIGNRKMALLELTEATPSALLVTRKSNMREGERDGAFEVTTIDVATGTVSMRNRSEPVEVRLEP